MGSSASPCRAGPVTKESNLIKGEGKLWFDPIFITVSDFLRPRRGLAPLHAGDEIGEPSRLVLVLGYL
jgi:hypothetical protein